MLNFMTERMEFEAMLIKNMRRRIPLYEQPEEFSNVDNSDMKLSSGHEVELGHTKSKSDSKKCLEFLPACSK